MRLVTQAAALPRTAKPVWPSGTRPANRTVAAISRTLIPVATRSTGTAPPKSGPKARRTRGSARAQAATAPAQDAARIGTKAPRTRARRAVVPARDRPSTRGPTARPKTGTSGAHRVIATAAPSSKNRKPAVNWPSSAAPAKAASIIRLIRPLSEPRAFETPTPAAARIVASACGSEAGRAGTRRSASASPTAPYAMPAATATRLSAASGS